MVETYWNIGRMIVEEEQKGKERAEYGKYLIFELSKQLTYEFGNGFTERNIRNMRQFYICFPIWHALRAELSWSHYRLLISIEKPQSHSWGKSVVEKLAADLQKEFEGMQGLSATNLWRMRAFYLAYTQETILPLPVGEISASDKNSIPQMLTDIGWSHNYVIVEKCKEANERLFYMLQTKK